MRGLGSLPRSTNVSGNVFIEYQGSASRAAPVRAWDWDYTSAEPLLSYITARWGCKARRGRAQPSGLRCRLRVGRRKMMHRKMTRRDSDNRCLPVFLCQDIHSEGGGAEIRGLLG